MRVAVHVEQVRRIDGRIDLGRAQAGMAEQFLECAQVGTAPQQMSREAVAQRMRRRALGQPESGPRRLD